MFVRNPAILPPPPCPPPALRWDACGGGPGPREGAVRGTGGRGAHRLGPRLPRRRVWGATGGPGGGGVTDAFMPQPRIGGRCPPPPPTVGIGPMTGPRRRGQECGGAGRPIAAGDNSKMGPGGAVPSGFVRNPSGWAPQAPEPASISSSLFRCSSPAPAISPPEFTVSGEPTPDAVVTGSLPPRRPFVSHPHQPHWLETHAAAAAAGCTRCGPRPTAPPRSPLSHCWRCCPSGPFCRARGQTVPTPRDWGAGRASFFPSDTNPQPPPHKVPRARGCVWSLV